MNNNDQKYFTQARQEVLDDDAILTLAKDLTRKSEQAQSIIDDSTFLKQVKELSSVKLGHDLKDIKDETN